MDMSIGIDLGTTNTVVSVARRGIHGDIDVQTEQISQISEDKITPTFSDLLPSVLYIDQDGSAYVGKSAKAMKSQNHKRVISNSKNFMGESGYKWQIDDKEYSPELVASYFLKLIRNHLKNKYMNEDLLKEAVITVPASFDIDQKRATKTAARLAGFQEDKIILISEPTAAMLDFINEQKKLSESSKIISFKEPKNILVFDLGGGTCDVSILRIQIIEDKISVEELEVSPHTLIGGTNFDILAANGVLKDYSEKNNINLKKILSKKNYEELLNQVIIKCEAAKLMFSGKYQMQSHLEENIRLDMLLKSECPISIPNILNGKPFIYNLSGEKYNQFIKPLINDDDSNENNILSPIRKTLNAANMTVEDIDYVFTVGGMSEYPTVNEAIKKYFKKEPQQLLNKMQSVSRGAAVYHYYNVSFSKNLKESVIDITPTMPQSIFLNVNDGLPITLIEAKTKAGTPKIHENLVSVNSELGVNLELYTGRSNFDPGLKKLKDIKINFPYGVKKGTPISLKIEYTSKGMINFEAWISNDKNIKKNVSIDGLLVSEKEIEETRNKFQLEKVKGGF